MRATEGPTQNRVLFEVTCVIGEVREDANGERSAYEAAMLLIAQHDTEGRFTFPLEGGGTQHVTIERDIPDERIDAP